MYKQPYIMHVSINFPDGGFPPSEFGRASVCLCTDDLRRTPRATRPRVAGFNFPHSRGLPRPISRVPRATLFDVPVRAPRLVHESRPGSPPHPPARSRRTTCEGGAWPGPAEPQCHGRVRFHGCSPLAFTLRAPNAPRRPVEPPGKPTWSPAVQPQGPQVLPCLPFRGLLIYGQVPENHSAIRVRSHGCSPLASTLRAPNAPRGPAESPGKPT